ncbi:hypothetical protein ACFW9D_05665 [Streptomyces sp. NPDC059524]|uniref:hypothetical protein n=1 Tax=Streptomyces sp. NPDC059524 TaxID=3346856 RepID=UPI0036AE712F
MKKGNKEGPEPGGGLARLRHHLRRWQARSLHEQVLRGAAYSVGSGAVSLILVWVESRF